MSIKNNVLWRPYCQMATSPAPLNVVRTQGSRLYLDDGRELLDGVASWWTACHGYNHPALVEALCAQAHAMPHIMLGGIAHPQASKLASRLAALLPGELNHVFFSDSGSVAIEVALKIAKQYWRHLDTPGKNKILCLEGAYHGDTLGAMSISEAHQRHLDPEEVLKGIFISLPKDESAWQKLEQDFIKQADSVAALIIEPLVQGAAGMKMHTPASLRRLCQLAHRHNILVIFDEIFTGFGRTGTFFACEQVDFVPDLICLSKGLTGGLLSLAATVASAPIFEAFLGPSLKTALWHGPTFMGNPLACAVANANLDLFEQYDWQLAVKNIEASFNAAFAKLKTHPLIQEVRVLGAIGVLELKHNKSTELQNFCIKQGLWLRPFGTCFYTTPCFNMDPLDLAKIGVIMSQALDCISE